MDRMGLGYDAIAGRAPAGRSTSRSPASATRSTRRTATGRRTRRSSRRCRASTSTRPAPTSRRSTIPVGALGDISSALFAVIGILAALRHRDRTGVGPVRRHRDARRDGRDDRHRHQLLVHGRAARAGQGPRGDLRGLPRRPTATSWCRSSREHQFATLAELVGHPSGRTIHASRPAPAGRPNLETVIRPAVDAWASQRTKLEAARALTAVGIAAGPSNSRRRRDRRPARRRPPHARRDAAHRRRRRAACSSPATR